MTCRAALLRGTHQEVPPVTLLLLPSSGRGCRQDLMEGSSKARPSMTLFLRWVIRVAREVLLTSTDKTELEAVPRELKLSV